ncbi:MAG: transposase [Clostridiales bacterium]|nr:transposase [Clostridiales bacterium]
MGKKLYGRQAVSESRTEALGIAGLLALKNEDKDNAPKHYEAVQECYFTGEKPVCPNCGSANTRCSKILKRKFKDILPNNGDTEQGSEKRTKSRVIDLTFYQRYFRCDDCGGIVFPEPITFGDKGCRYTNRLSDVLAEGTFRHSYKKVCEYYGVPASTSSVGPIMRRRISYKESLMQPLYTPRVLGIIEVNFYHDTYPVVFALYKNTVYCIDILADSYEDTVLAYLRNFDASKVSGVYIDPADGILSAVTSAFVEAEPVVTDECLLRYARNAMIKIIQSDGKRFPVPYKETALTMQEKYQNEHDKNQIKDGMASRPRLRSAYDVHQKFMRLMSDNWTYEDLREWVSELPPDLTEFSALVETIENYEQEIRSFINMDIKPPKNFKSATNAICDAFHSMPHCIFDVLKARCFLTTPFDTIEENGKKYRLGIPIDRFTQSMSGIANSIKEDRFYGL